MNRLYRLLRRSAQPAEAQGEASAPVPEPVQEDDTERFKAGRPKRPKAGPRKTSDEISAIGPGEPDH